MVIDDVTTSWVILFARVSLATVFLVSGIHKALWYEKAALEFRDAGIPFLQFFLPATIVLHLAASLALIFGIFVRESALVLALFTVVATLKVHCFWRMSGAERLNRSRVALAHLAVVGGLLLLAVVGPGDLVL